MFYSVNREGEEEEEEEEDAHRVHLTRCISKYCHRESFLTPHLVFIYALYGCEIFTWRLRNGAPYTLGFSLCFWCLRLYLPPFFAIIILILILLSALLILL